MYSKRQASGGGTPRSVHFLAWGPVTLSPASRRPAYSLAFTVFDRVHVCALEYDFRAMRYLLSAAPATLPPTGFTRAYTCGALDAAGRMVLAGTTAGEAAVYAIVPGAAPAGAAAPAQPVPVFKTALVAAGNGVHALLVARESPDRGAGAVRRARGRRAVGRAKRA